MAALVHGGDLTAARARWPGAAEPLIDLSTGLNPWPYPLPPLDPAVYARLPGAEVAETCLESVAQYLGLDDPDTIALVPGSQAAITRLPTLLEAPSVAVAEPAYEEHRHSWAAAGRAVGTITRDELDAAPHAAIVLVNPGNPDGAATDRDTVLAAAERLGAQGGWLIVDEAFADVAADVSVAGHGGMSGLIVLRSFGKFFGLAGLRFGAVVAPRDVAARVRAAFGPWAVSGPALAIAGQAYRDRPWQGETRARLTRAATRLRAMLADAGLTSVGGTDLFQTAAHDRAAVLFDALGKAGLYVRHFPNRPTWLRFGLPPDDAAWSRLATVLNQWMDP